MFNRDFFRKRDEKKRDKIVSSKGNLKTIKFNRKEDQVVDGIYQLLSGGIQVGEVEVKGETVSVSIFATEIFSEDMIKDEVKLQELRNLGSWWESLVKDQVVDEKLFNYYFGKAPSMPEYYAGQNPMIGGIVLFYDKSSKKKINSSLTLGKMNEIIGDSAATYVNLLFDDEESRNEPALANWMKFISPVVEETVVEPEVVEVPPTEVPTEISTSGCTEPLGEEVSSEDPVKVESKKRDSIDLSKVDRNTIYKAVLENYKKNGCTDINLIVPEKIKFIDYKNWEYVHPYYWGNQDGVDRSYDVVSFFTTEGTCRMIRLLKDSTRTSENLRSVEKKISIEEFLKGPISISKP